MAVSQTPKLQSQNIGALFASLNVAGLDRVGIESQITYMDQVAAAFKKLCLMETHPFQNKTNGLGCKNAETAASRRRQANKLLNKSRKNPEEKHEVLLLLSQYICATPYPSEDSGVSGEQLATAFAERADFFLNTYDYDLCLGDLQNALDVYPQAPQSIKDQWAATKALALERKIVKENIKSEIELKNHLADLVAKDPGLLPATLSYPEHKTLKGAADCFEVRPDPRTVTRLVATADIRIGDVILKEKPFASVLRAECLDTHCYHCLSPNVGMLPCKTCSMVMYCSDKCRESDYRLFHQWECKLLGVLMEKYTAALFWVPTLALRIFIVAVYTYRGLDSLLDFVEFLGTQGVETNRGFDSEGGYDLPCDFPTVHFSTRGPSVNTELPELAAILLLGLDTATSFFERFPADINKKMNVGALLLRYAVVARDLMYNVENVSPLVKGKWSKWTVASAHFPVAALAKRSCGANTISAYRGDNLVLMACENIASGEEITTGHGFSYLTHDLKTRQAAHLFFPGDCRCKACVEQWPLEKALSQLQPTYLCLKCKATLPFELNEKETDVLADCPQCHNPNNILTNKIEEEEVKLLLNTIQEKISNNEPPALFSGLLIKALQRLSSFLRPPNIQLVRLSKLLHDSFRFGGPGNNPRSEDNSSDPKSMCPDEWTRRVMRTTNWNINCYESEPVAGPSNISLSEDSSDDEPSETSDLD